MISNSIENSGAVDNSEVENPTVQDESNGLKVEVPHEQSESSADPSLSSSFTAGSPTTPVMLIPSLRGTMTYAGGSITCKGKWAMSDQAHQIPGQTSDFEFKLVQADAEGLLFPVNGKYQGWFMVRQPLPLKGSIKVEDKEMSIKFEANGSDFNIIGNGHNKFGKFNLTGTLSEQGEVHILREYYFFNPVPSPTVRVRPDRPEIKREKSAPVVNTAATATVETPREGSGRVRKMTEAFKEFRDPLNRSKASASESVAGVDESTTLSKQVSQERSHRAPPFIRKCVDLLKELMKMPQGKWFLEPVDHVKFNIPDYPKVIKTPMDFGTIKKKLDVGLYESIDGFAEHVRLVFRNAITFNTAKDNIVNISARELSTKFEDRYGQLVNQLESPADLPAEHAPPVKTQKASGPPSMAKPIPQLKRQQSASSSKAGKDSSARTPRSAPGPRQQLPFVPPAAMDGNTSQLLELQRQMQMMQEELLDLRAKVRENEISKQLNEAKEASQNPLTFEEKKTLVAQVHKLPPELMGQVIDIIREGLPDNGSNGEQMEVPLDMLDTLTLRKLQRLVRDNVFEVDNKKKRPPSFSRQSTGRASDPAPKKSKKNAAASAAQTAVSDPVHSMEGDEMELFDNDELLLDTDNFPVNQHDNYQEDTGDFATQDFADIEDYGATQV